MVHLPLSGARAALGGAVPARCAAGAALGVAAPWGGAGATLGGAAAALCGGGPAVGGAGAAGVVR